MSPARFAAFFLAIACGFSAPLACAQSAPADPPAADAGPLRVHGVIRDDQRWSGTVLVTETTRIQGATVTVAPGTVIAFAGRPTDPNPQLIVGSPQGDPGLLLMEATGAQPIRIVTSEGLKAGVLVVHLAPGRSLAWRHVQFERMGYSTALKPVEGLPELPMLGPDGRQRMTYVPAVSISADSAKSRIELHDCLFVASSRLTIRVAHELELRRSRFEQGIDRFDCELGGAPTARAVVTGCRFAGIVGGFDPALEFSENLLIGPRTALIVSGGGGRASIVGNYIHNTNPIDDGSFCLKCGDADAEIRDNVLRGGTYVVLEGSRRMSGNVLVSAPRLDSPTTRTARTHYLVAELPARATFENNVLIGPAYALLATQAARRAGRGDRARSEPITDILIQHNVFDGMGNTSQALRLNVLAREPLNARITDNLFLRVASLVMDEARLPGTVARLEGNSAAPRPAKPLDGLFADDGKPMNFDGSNRVLESVAALDLPAPPAAPPDPWDDALTRGTTTIGKVRAEAAGWYRR